MKTDLLKKLLNELDIEPIPENSVSLAIKKAINNPIYWFCFRHKKLVENIGFAASILMIITAIFITNTFVSITPFSSNYIRLYLFFGLCATIIVAIISAAMSIKILLWDQKTYKYMPALNDPLRKIFEKFENAVGSSEYYKGEISLSEQRINKKRFVFVRDKDDNRCCINISVIA